MYPLGIPNEFKETQPLYVFAQSMALTISIEIIILCYSSRTSVLIPEGGNDRTNKLNNPV